MTHESGTLMERWLGKLAADDCYTCSDDARGEFRGVRRNRHAWAVCDPGALASGLHERATRLRHRPAVLRHLRHLVGEFGREFRAGEHLAGARRRLRPPSCEHSS
jgi:hypothetical protein